MGSSFGIVLGFDASPETSEEGRKEYLDFGGKVKSGRDLKAIVEGSVFAIVEDMTDVNLNTHQQDDGSLGKLPEGGRGLPS
jgi:hypothetical protein